MKIEVTLRKHTENKMVKEIIALIKAQGFKKDIDVERISKKIGIEFIYQSKDDKPDTLVIDKILKLIREKGFNKDDIERISKKIVNFWDFIGD